MQVLSDVVTYSGWIGTLLSVAYIVVQRVEGRREREQKDQLARMLARVSVEPILLGADLERSSRQWPASRSRNERLRAALIRAAAGHQPLRSVVLQVEGMNCDQDEVIIAAQALAERGLLQVEEPLTLDSILRLRV